MANEVEKYNTLALADIEKINGFTDDDIEKLNGFEFSGVTLLKAIFAFGRADSGLIGISSLVNDVGVIASDTSAVGTARELLAAADYGTGTAIFAFGNTGSKVTTKNLINTSGVVASDATGAGTARSGLAACEYGTGLAIFAYGNEAGYVSMSNLVNTLVLLLAT